AGSKITQLAVDAATGTLTTPTDFDSTFLNPLGYATDASGRLFATSDVNGTIFGFSAPGSSAPLLFSDLAVSGLTSPLAGVLHPAGYYYVSGYTGGNLLQGFKITGTGVSTKLASAGFANSDGTTPTCLALDQFGNVLWVANIDSRNLTSFHVNPASGALE